MFWYHVGSFKYRRLPYSVKNSENMKGRSGELCILCLPFAAVESILTYVIAVGEKWKEKSGM